VKRRQSWAWHDTRQLVRATDAPPASRRALQMLLLLLQQQQGQLALMPLQ
jgi:hypothetical protein